MNAPDLRLTLARPDLADAALEGLVPAARYVAPELLRVIAASAPVRRGADPNAEQLDQLLYGERYRVLARAGAFVWGQAERDGYVGFVPPETLAPGGAAPTHRVAALRTFAFAEPSIKSPPAGPFSLNALVTVEAEEGVFARADNGLWFRSVHLAPVCRFEADPAAVAERFLGAPYLWGGRDSVGLDCSGLVQQALYACGLACPRDSDQQAALGRDVSAGERRRGDLVCWRGHVGMMLDETRLIHANAFHMAVAIEPLAEAVARIEAAGSGAPTAWRRL